MNLDTVILVVAAGLGCYMAACHTALKTFSRRRLADLLEARPGPARAQVTTAQLGQLVLVTGLLRAGCGIAVVMAVLHGVERRWPQLDLSAAFGIAFGISFVVLGLLIVVVPTSWANYRRERLLAWSLPILHGLRLALWPVVMLARAVDPVIRRVSGADLGDDEDQLTDEVLTVVADHEAGDQVDAAQKEMIEAVFELPTTTAGEIMTPRTDIEGIDAQATLAQVREAVIEAGHSRVPVFGESLDDIQGMLYAKDLIAYVGGGGAFDLPGLLREPYLVPESKKLSDLLTEFKSRKVHIAVVLDEYGGTAGLVTIEDILEELVGDIQDEYEDASDEPPVIVEVDEMTSEVEARVYIDDLNNRLGVELPEDADYDTVGGFVFASLGHIPEVGESFEFDGLRFTVMDAERTRVNRVRIERREVGPDEGKE